MNIVDNRIARIKQVINAQNLLTKKQTIAFIKAILNKRI